MVMDDDIAVTDSIMVTDDNRTPLWIRTIGLHCMVTDDNRTPSWLRMTTGLHYGYG